MLEISKLYLVGVELNVKLPRHRREIRTRDSCRPQKRRNALFLDSTRADLLRKYLNFGILSRISAYFGVFAEALSKCRISKLKHT